MAWHMYVLALTLVILAPSVVALRCKQCLYIEYASGDSYIDSLLEESFSYSDPDCARASTSPSYNCLGTQCVVIDYSFTMPVPLSNDIYVRSIQRSCSAASESTGCQDITRSDTFGNDYFLETFDQIGATNLRGDICFCNGDCDNNGQSPGGSWDSGGDWSDGDNWGDSDGSGDLDRPRGSAVTIKMKLTSLWVMILPGLSAAY